MKSTVGFLKGFFTVIIAALMCRALAEVVSCKFLNDKDHLKLVERLLSTGELNGRIIFNFGKPYISLRVDGGHILSKYYVEGFGEVPRNTNMHKMIKVWIDSSEKVKLQNLINSIK